MCTAWRTRAVREMISWEVGGDHLPASSISHNQLHFNSCFSTRAVSRSHTCRSGAKSVVPVSSFTRAFLQRHGLEDQLAFFQLDGHAAVVANLSGQQFARE